ncbi:hypothetical protein RISW2_04375 [Roseivivax isoporae LMG 25204]|uniref:Phage protein Gp37/Gp68 n=2 Tax=Roseivivax TaxID=93682 RepID=X7F0X5_9RHOB|nr:hypothetical protein RISW2_04375 [Roseivivax isoporae LMG 25204]
MRRWPLSNVWLGVSAEDQRRADERVPHLLATPAVVRFVSAEPLLGPVGLTRWSGLEGDGDTMGFGLDWVIVGGESGPGARPMHPDWARSLRDQCTAAGVPFFFKQWGAWAPDEIGPEDIRSVEFPPGHVEYLHVGKRAAGRKLDGRNWDEVPA